MTAKAKAPLRIGLAGGGTDVSPYCDLFGGEVVNAAISLYAHAKVRSTDEDVFRLQHADLVAVSFPLNQEIALTGDPYDLHAGVINRFLKRYGDFRNGVIIETEVDVPLGSGLGTSSTLIVSIIGALLEFLDLQMDKKDIAALACRIEREDLDHAGGKQDQYAACFGGINSIKFFPNSEISIEPIMASPAFLGKFEQHLLLFYTSHNRFSSRIIEEQIGHVVNGDREPVEAMHLLKDQSRQLKLAFEQEDYSRIVSLIDQGFACKKKMASGITNERIDRIYEAAKNAGALAGKISGAGGGGFMIFCVSDSTVSMVRKALLNFTGKEYKFHFDRDGLITWRE